MTALSYSTPFLFLCIISACSALKSCGPFTQYTSTFFLCQGQTISTNGEIKFELGFFTPKGNYNNSTYVGIWHLDDPETVVWVANRDQPLPKNSTGSFGVRNDGDGNLQLLDEKGNPYFSTQLKPSRRVNSRTVRLLESGNLVLINERPEEMLWQSFDHPTDTFLPGMKMSDNLKLISWKDRYDPSTGNFRFRQGEEGTADSGSYIIMNRTVKHWKSGRRSRNFNASGMIDLAAYLLNNYNPVKNPPNLKNPPNFNTTPKSKPIYRNPQNLNPDFNKTRLLMNFTGKIEYFQWDGKRKIWLKIWSEPQTPCSVYDACGKFASCRGENGFSCSCLPGFESTVMESWNPGDYSGGCSRKTNICDKKVTNYTFSLLNVIKVRDRDYFYEAQSEKECKEECLKATCQCQAYSFRYGRELTSGCDIWTADLADLQLGDDPNLRNISVKIAISTSGVSVQQNQTIGSHPQSKSSSLRVVIILIIIGVIAVVLLVCGISYIYYRRMVAKIKESKKGIKAPPQLSEEDKKNIDVPFFELESILAATDFFSDANKLGQGGFGPVYKGMFPGGQEIAVKRLAVHSMQGLEELKNEVVLIAKLQHRNLVRLLGYCIDGEENILLYEYMPNKSLDAFIFDQKLCVLLDWEKRFEIIWGIARGLLYLHQDSRLRVIHRDLKASNILLDEDMNPKISDFGLARIVAGRETEANTNKVVGTYGYMSPEYALDGLFSIKSDVFSFGVVVLEIISGKRNTGIFFKTQHDLNLLGYTWRLWEEDNPLGMMDQTIVEFCNKSEVLKCIIIGLLCVQEDPGDRPTMSNIVLMLGNTDIGSLPSPKQPAFVARTNQQSMSSNEAGVSLVKGR